MADQLSHMIKFPFDLSLTKRPDLSRPRQLVKIDKYQTAAFVDFATRKKLKEKDSLLNNVSN